MRTVLILAAALACSCKDAAKEKELAELRAKVANIEAPPLPGLSAVRKAAPEISRPGLAQREVPPDSVEPPTEKDRIAAKVKHAAIDIAAFQALYLESQSPESKKLSYALLKKNPGRFSGTTWALTGKVIEIQETSGVTICRLALDYYQQNIVFLAAFGVTDFVEGDVVDVLGVLNGSYSYTSEAGWNITIPSMVGTRLLKHGELAKLKKLLAEPAKNSAPHKKTSEEVDELTN